MFKYDGTLVEKCACPNNKLNAAVWVPSKRSSSGAYLFVDKPPTPKNEAAKSEGKLDDQPKKKKMNLKWDEDADVFHKTEGLKSITTEDIEAFNKVYDTELNAKIQKEKEAAEKLERMQKKAAEAGKGEVPVKGPTVLQRGAFKRGEKAEKTKEQAGDDGEGPSTARDPSKKEDGDNTSKTQQSDKPEGHQKRQNKKDKDQSKQNNEENGKQGQSNQQPKEGKKNQNKNQGQNNGQGNPRQRIQAQPKEEQDKNATQTAHGDNKEKPQLTEGTEPKPTNQKKKKQQNKNQAQGKTNPKQQQVREQEEDMNFMNQGMQWGMMNNFHGQEHQTYPPGLFMMPQNSHVNPLYPAYMSDDLQPINKYGMPHMGHQMSHPMMQMPYYPQMGHEHDGGFDNGMNQNLIEEQYIKQMLNLNTNMPQQNRAQPKQNRGNNK